jgi:23S rRNA pseudouridine2604 synthase
MAAGVPILDTVTLPCKIQSTGKQTFRITLTQGLNRQIRRMCEYLGYEVTALQRVRIMNIKLDKLPLGKWRLLNEVEISQLKDSVATSSKTGFPEQPAKVTAPAKRARPEAAAPVKKSAPEKTSKIVKAAPATTSKTAKTAPAKTTKAVPAKQEKTSAARPQEKKKSGSFKAFREKGRQR